MSSKCTSPFAYRFREPIPPQNYAPGRRFSRQKHRHAHGILCSDFAGFPLASAAAMAQNLMDFFVWVILRIGGLDSWWRILRLWANYLAPASALFR